MKVVEIAKSVEVDGVVFTEGALEALVHLARKHAQVSLYLVGGEIVFKEEVPVPLSEEKPSWRSGAAPGHRMNTHVCSPHCVHNNG